MNFANVTLFIDVDDEDNRDRSGLGISSILSSSPSGTHHDVANSSDLGAINVLRHAPKFLMQHALDNPIFLINILLFIMIIILIFHVSIYHPHCC